MSRPDATASLAAEVVADLLRSAWLVEAARARLYEAWSSTEPRFEASAARSRRRAEIVGRGLEARGQRPDRHLVDAHGAWMLRLAGRAPGEPLTDLFVARLGDWVDGHARPFLDGDAAALTALGDEERAGLAFPAELPPPPPFAPLEVPLVEPPGDASLRVGILGDLHIGSPAGEAMARAAIADLNASGAELVVQLGDITDSGERSEFERASAVLAELAVPFATMMGNHDVFSMSEGRVAGLDYYEASFGRRPEGVLIEHRGVRFVVLDSAATATSPFAPFDIVSGRFLEGPGGAVVRGELTAQQHEVLADVAAPGAPPAFVFLHHPPQPFTGFPPVLFGLRDVDTGRLHATCDSGNVWGVFAGHTHRNARTRDFDGVPAHEVAIARDYPFGYALLDVSEAGYAYRFVQLSDEALLREAYARTSAIHRRYGAGAPTERSFVWVAPRR